MEFWMHDWITYQGKTYVSRQLYSQSNIKSHNLDWTTNDSRFKILENLIWQRNVGYIDKNKAVIQEIMVQ